MDVIAFDALSSRIWKLDGHQGLKACKIATKEWGGWQLPIISYAVKSVSLSNNWKPASSAITSSIERCVLFVYYKPIKYIFLLVATLTTCDVVMTKPKFILHILEEEKNLSSTFVC
jgi:hypothetical protein